MSLVQVASMILLAAVSVGPSWAVQSDDRVHDVAQMALSIIRKNRTVPFHELLLKVALLSAENDQEQVARELFQEVLKDAKKHNLPNELRQVVVILAEAEFHEDALQAYEAIPPEFNDNGENDRCLATISRCLAKSLSLDLARSTCERINNSHWQSLALTNLAIAYFKLGDRKAAESLLAEAIECAKKSEKDDRVWMTLEFIVMSLGAHELREEARVLVAPEIANGAETDLDWYSILNIQAECGNVDGALRAGKEFKLRSRSAWADEHFLQCLVKAQAKASMVDEARETATELIKSEHYSLGARDIAEALIRQGRLDEALNVNETIDETERDGWVYITTLLDVATIYRDQGNLEKAAELLRKSRKLVSTKTPKDLSFMGFVHGELGFDSELIDWVNSLKPTYSKVTALIGLGNGILKRSKTPE